MPPEQDQAARRVEMVMDVEASRSGERRDLRPIDLTYERPVRRIRQHAWDTFSVAAFSLGASATATAIVWILATVLS